MSTVVVLLSDKRSGSTMLQTELCRHPSIAHVTSSPHTYHETHYWLMAAVILGRPAAVYANGRTYDGYGSPKNARAYMEQLLAENAPDFRPPQDDAELVAAGWDALIAAHKAPVFFEKSPQVLEQWVALDLFLEWAATTEHKVRVIGLVRNPMAVQYSAQMLFNTDPDHRQYAWLAAYRNLLAVERILPEDRYLRVRYDDVIGAPQEVFRAIQEFIGVDPNEAVGRDVHAKSTEKWRQDPEFSISLDPAVARMAGVFGYALDDLAVRAPSTPGKVTDRRQSAGSVWLNRQRHRIVKPALMRLKSAIRRQG